MLRSATTALFLLMIALPLNARTGMIDFENASNFGGDNAVISDTYFNAYGVSFGATAGRFADTMSSADLLFEAAGSDNLFGFTGEFGHDTEAPAAAGTLGDFLMTTSANNGRTNGPANRFFTLTIDFATAVQDVRAEIWDIDRREQYQVTAYESNGGVVASLLSPDGQFDSHDALPWVWSVSGDQISSVEIEYVGNGTIGQFAFDNFSFQTATTTNPDGTTHANPLPSAFSLGLAGLFGLAVRRQRPQKE